MPTIDIRDRICPHCGGIRWKVEQEKRKYGVITRYRCAKRAYERHKRWIDGNPEKVNEYDKKKIQTRKATGYYKTPKMREYARLKHKRESDTLSDNYVLRMLAAEPKGKNTPRLKRSEIPQRLIELKRKQLLLNRQLKSLENEKTN